MHHEKQQQAHDLYFNTDKTQQEIADILDVNRRTIYLWSRQGNWAAMKAAARQMPALILQNIYNHITAVNDNILSRDEADRCPTMEEVEKLRKLLAMTRSIQKQHTGSYIEAFQELQLFIFNRDATLATQLRGHIADYARGTIGDKEFMARKRRKDNVLDVAADLARQEMKEQESAAENCYPEFTEGCYPGPVEGEIFCDKTTPMKNENTGPVEGALSNRSHSKGGLPLDNRTMQTTGAGCDANGIFCDKMAPMENDNVGAENAPQPTAAQDIKEMLSISETAKYTVQDFSEHGIFVPEGVGNEPEDDPIHFGRAMQLPPHMRPSPYIVGDTVWILHPDHLENRLDTYGNEWGPIKMNQAIRYYPDVDPANTKAA